MKRTILAASMAAILVACIGGRALFSGTAQAQQGASAGTKVAVVNIGLVFTKYDKAAVYKAEMEELLKPFRAKGEKLKKEITDWQEWMKSPKFDKKETERYLAGIKNNQRALEDLDMDARKLVGKKQEEQIITLYKDVEAQVKTFANANGIHLVLAYGEQIEGDLFSFPNINRKMQGMDLGGAHPLYFHNSVDISGAVADSLNAAWRAAGGKKLEVTPTGGGKK